MSITCTEGDVIRMLFANFGRTDGLGVMTKTNEVGSTIKLPHSYLDRYCY